MKTASNPELGIALHFHFGLHSSRAGEVEFWRLREERQLASGAE